MMSDSPQNGGRETSNPDQPSGKYSTRTGAANQDGIYFEIKMCALVFLRAVQSYSSFTMTSNDPRAGAFDDIVLSYGSPGNEQSILVQLKTSRKSLNLCSPQKKSLKYYFKSLKNTNISANFKNYKYVFFTNADVKLNPSAANIESPANKLLCTTWKPDNVLQVDLNHDICKDFKDDSGAEDFVNRLLIFRNQCDPQYLDELINQELIRICNGFVPECRAIQKNFVEKITTWWEEREKTALDENWKEWTELKAQLIGQNALLKQIKFSEDTLSHLEGHVLGSESDIIVLKSDSTEAQIASSKVCQTFIRKVNLPVLFTDLSEPQSSQNMLFNLWSEDVFEVLVITDVTNRCLNLGEKIANYIGNSQKQNKKKVVIVSSRDASTLGLSQVLEFDTDFIKSTFNQLDDNSRDSLRNLEVDFQGKEIILGKIMDDNILEGGILQYVLTSPKIQIGIALPARNEKYIPRTLSKTFLVNEGIFKSDDVFYIGGAWGHELYGSVAKARGEEITSEELFGKQKHGFHAIPRRELYEAINGFKCCAKILPEGPVHFLEQIRDKFYWIHSHGSTDDLFKYIDWSSGEEDCRKLRDAKSSLAKEEDLVRKEFQTVIVTDEPGSGKTTLFLEMANKMKELNPHRWIIHVDLNEHSGILSEMKQAVEVTRENVLRLLSKAANLDDSELGKQLLKCSVLKSGDICILFDAFDEIAPLYTDTVLAILKLISSEFKLSTLWIASRYNMKEALEEELKSKVFRIEPLSDEEQIYFMSMFWGKEKAKEFHETITDKLPFPMRSSPLNIKMMCEMYPGEDMPDKFSDVAKVYEQFIENKFNIYAKEKTNLNSPSPAMGDAKNREREHFMESHMVCSLYVLELYRYTDEPLRSSIEKKVRIFCNNIREGKERLGIIDGVVADKPHFIHRTIAEYFAAKWLAEHWKENSKMYCNVFHESLFQFVHMLFCLEVDRELPVHLAVLNQDINALEGLKQEDLNKRDVVGRTPLHLAVIMDGRKTFNMVSALLKHRPNLDIRDEFGCRPLFYAATRRQEDVVRILEEHGARLRDRSDYDNLMVRDCNLLESLERPPALVEAATSYFIISVRKHARGGPSSQHHYPSGLENQE